MVGTYGRKEEMKEEEGVTLTKIILISVGSYLIGSEYSAALGWGVFFISIALD